MVKLWAENRVLAQTTPPSLASSSSTPAKPIQFDIDLSQLTKSVKVGEKAVVEVLTTKPLAIALKAEPVFREQIVIDRIKQLLLQLEAKPQLANLATALKALSLPSPVQGQIQHLVGHILDKQAITQPQALKQAIASSGVFTERHALRPNPILSTDFKANLLKVAAVIEGELKGKPVQLTSSPLLNKTSTLSDLTASTKPVATPLSTGSLGKSQVITAGTVAPFAGTANLLSIEGSVTISQQVSIPPLATDKQLSSSPLSTGSLGKSTVAAPSAAITGSNGNTTVQNPTVSTIKPNAEGQVKTAALTSPLTFQNVTKPTEGGVDKANTVISKTNVDTTLRTTQKQTTTQTAVSLPTALPAFLESVLTSQQAAALAQALNKSISAEQLRASGQFDILVLQGLLKKVETTCTRAIKSVFYA